MKGMIICGYPGVGKSSVAGWHNCIDLESSNFSHCPFVLDDTNYLWEEHYVKVAADLAKQGYTVLLSTHPDVLEEVKKIEKIPVVIFCPRLSMKEQWNERLKNRYEQTRNPKDKRAWDGAMKNWERNIEHLFDYGLPVVQPAAIDYDLKNYIFYCQAKYCDMQEEGGDLERAHALITYLQERLESAEIRAQSMSESYTDEFYKRLAVEKERDCYKYQNERRDGF